jgi:hypothetical protein
VNENDESGQLTHENGGTTPPTEENSPGAERRSACTRRHPNWAWATLCGQYDWMDLHSLSGEFLQH